MLRFLSGLHFFIAGSSCPVCLCHVADPLSRAFRCFQLLALMNHSGACLCVDIGFHFFQGSYLGVELLVIW